MKWATFQSLKQLSFWLSSFTDWSWFTLWVQSGSHASMRWTEATVLCSSLAPRLLPLFSMSHWRIGEGGGNKANYTCRSSAVPSVQHSLWDAHTCTHTHTHIISQSFSFGRRTKSRERERMCVCVCICVCLAWFSQSFIESMAMKVVCELWPQEKSYNVVMVKLKWIPFELL